MTVLWGAKLWTDVWGLNLARFTPQRKNPQYPLNRRLGGPQSCTGCFGEENISCPCWDLNTGLSSLSLVFILTLLSWLPQSYSNFFIFSVLFLFALYFYDGHYVNKL
jgi:hypothetical protein